MIALLIFYIHLVAGVYAFARGYFEHKLVDGFMSLAFFGVIFSVGWTMAGFIVRFLIPEDGFAPWLDPDTISLLIVTTLEAVLYSVYFHSRKPAAA